MSRIILAFVPGLIALAEAGPSLLFPADAAPQATPVSRTATMPDLRGSLSQPRPFAGLPVRIQAPVRGFGLVDGDGDGVPAARDCNDNDATIYPGAPETCDGIDHDCDGYGPEPESITFVADAGSIVDFAASANFSRPDRPQRIALDEPGSLLVCASTVYATIDISADVSIDAAETINRGRPVFDAAGSGSVVTIHGQGLQVDIAGVTLQGGAADQGGGLACTGENSVYIEDVTVADSVAEQGGGIYVEACELDIVESMVVGNTATGDGGGIAVNGGTVRIDEAMILENTSDNGAGGIIVHAAAMDARVELYNSTVRDNIAESYAGGIAVQALGEAQGTVDVECSDPSAGALDGNRAELGAHLGVYAAPSSASGIEVRGCAMGNDGQAGQAIVDNTERQRLFSKLDTAALRCTAEGCD